MLLAGYTMQAEVNYEHYTMEIRQLVQPHLVSISS